MGVFGVWCGKCVKYLAFGTFITPAVDALRVTRLFQFLFFFLLSTISSWWDKSQATTKKKKRKKRRHQSDNKINLRRLRNYV